MQVQVTDLQPEDVVLDSNGKVWQYTGPGGAVQWNDLQMVVGSMSGPEPSGPAGEVTLLVRDGAQLCCTPDGHLH